MAEAITLLTERGEYVGGQALAPEGAFVRFDAWSSLMRAGTYFT